MQSEAINELATALSKAQAVMGGAHKDSTNPFFKSKYADLESVWDAIKKPLTDNGLAVIQTNEPCDDGVCVVTTLVHSSGQWVKGRLSVKLAKFDAQSVGSANTYLRRYSLAGISGMYQTDDDGNAATSSAEKPAKPDSELNKKYAGPLVTPKPIQSNSPF